MPICAGIEDTRDNRSNNIKFMLWIMSPQKQLTTEIKNWPAVPVTNIDNTISHMLQTSTLKEDISIDTCLSGNFMQYFNTVVCNL